MSGILVVMEQRGGRIARICWEALAAAQRLGDSASITAVVVGAQTEALAAEAGSRTPGKVLRVEHALLQPYTADGYITALQQLIQREDARVRGIPAHVPGSRLRACACRTFWPSAD